MPFFGWDMEMAPKDRIIFALDVPDAKEAARYVDLLKDHVGLFKVGLELFVACGPSIVKEVRERSGRGVFLDMKFHDIPATVAGAMRSACTLGAEFVTVHTDEGSELLEVAVSSAGDLKVLGVTVLTSLSKAGLLEIGIDPVFKEPRDLVVHRARLSRLSGCAGVVCSGHEAKAVKDEFGKNFIVVTPGIRSNTDDVGDQKRVVTAYEAVKNGADYIVVGRPIRKAPDPVKAAMSIADEIERALRDRQGE